ncbi:hypothetical protein [uncultured Roseobacter sp.]|uniref:hypothetical protein n=1 Tax=uncultured Roseobacter sp. TaxID=114847 RepID=UPI002602E47C|nr:hypothetical protein [uncultured Roseobacter sp.]
MRRSIFPILAALLPLNSHAQEAATTKQIQIELNAAATDQQSCHLTFVVQNELPGLIEDLVLETVLFTTDGQVDRLTLFSFGALPAGRQRVRQFAVDGLACDKLGRVLFNGTEQCVGETLTPAACEEALKASTRTNIEVLQ